MKVQSQIKIGMHCENYESWLSAPVFYLFGAFAAVAAILLVLSRTVFHTTVLTVIATVVLVALLGYGRLPRTGRNRLQYG